ncbi:MAG: shikimate dehydrogenase [Granulosicoccus sp.]
MMINRYTVIGQPIAHSLSPVVHHLFGELTQRKINYTRTESTPEEFEQTVRHLNDSGAKGCNVTSPFKEQAVLICDRLSREAQMAGSVNTIHMQRDGSMVGHTTDGPGLVADIIGNKRHAIKDGRVLILGAGGAARGVMHAILKQRPAQLHVANRTAEKAATLAEIFSDLGPVAGSGFEQLVHLPAFDIVINATTLGMSGTMPDLPEHLMASGSLAYDMTYAQRDTAFMLWAKERGAMAANGLGMLVEQAAESFLIWEDVRPKTRMVYPRLRDMLA